MARKPLAGTVAANVLAHGTGALNIDGTRIESESRPHIQNAGRADLAACYGKGKSGSINLGITSEGRWPANVVLDEDAAAQLDRQSGWRDAGRFPGRQNVEPGSRGTTMGVGWSGSVAPERDLDSGGASRFYYTAKAAPDERPRVNGVSHPTVKPLDLIRWLVRLVTPSGGLVLDPFTGSGTTGEACLVEGFRCVLIEREADYLPLIRARLSKPIQPVLGVAP